MSIRLDPRRAGILKQLAADAGTRPGELVRIWVEERLDAERRGEGRGAPASDLASIVQALGERVAALERAASAGSATQAEASGTGSRPTEATPEAERDEGAEPASTSTGQADVEGTAEAHPTGASQDGERPKRRRNAVSAAPAGERVALHDEMIAVIAERGPLPASELAAIITERGRYTPPRSGKPLDALTVSARVSNPTYRGRFTRAGGRIGLAEG